MPNRKDRTIPRSQYVGNLNATISYVSLATEQHALQLIWIASLWGVQVVGDFWDHRTILRSIIWNLVLEKVTTLSQFLYSKNRNYTLMIFIELYQITSVKHMVQCLVHKGHLIKESYSHCNCHWITFSFK